MLRSHSNLLFFADKEANMAERQMIMANNRSHSKIRTFCVPFLAANILRWLISRGELVVASRELRNDSQVAPNDTFHQLMAKMLINRVCRPPVSACTALAYSRRAIALRLLSASVGATAAAELARHSSSRNSDQTSQPLCGSAPAN